MTPDDLITPPEQLLAYRKAIAIEKKVIARPYLEEAKALKCIARNVRWSKDFLDLKDFHVSLFAASGLSANIFNNLNDVDKACSIQKFIDKFSAQMGKNFADELESGYFRSKRNILRSHARNLADSLAYRSFLRTLIAVLSLADIEYSWKDRNSQAWVHDAKITVGAEQNVSALYWRKRGKDRLLILNVSVPLIAKNVDLVVLDAKPADLPARDMKLLEHNCMNFAGLTGKAQ